MNIVEKEGLKELLRDEITIIFIKIEGVILI
jgi:hypothetical protein